MEIISEVMIGLKADERATARMRTFLDEIGLSKLPITAAGADIGATGLDRIAVDACEIFHNGRYTSVAGRSAI